jgi:hypothetical protein
MADTPKLDMPELASGQAYPEVTHNEAIRTLDALVQCNAIDKDLADAPGAPSDGDTYIVASGSTSGDDWDGHENDIAYYKSTSWVFYTPIEGWKAYLQDENTGYTFNGSSWVSDAGATESGMAYDVGLFFPGKPTASQEILRIPFVRGVDFADDLAGSQAKSGTAANASTEFSIRKNGVEFATATFAGAATTATFVTGSTSESFSAGDYLTIVAPGTPDSTLADIGFMLKGTKQ